MKKFQLVTQCKGYRAREDITNLPPGYLVKGSRDVLTNSANRLSVRKGFTIDGATNAALTPIESSYDWINHLGYERNMRSYGDFLQYRYVDSLGVVTWRTLFVIVGGPVAFNYTTFWDTTEFIDELLFVNGSSNIYQWNGAVTTVASNTATTITKQGTTTWAEEGFYNLLSGRAIQINGVTYTYTGGETTTTLTGLTALPAFSAGDVVEQAVVTTPNSSMSSIPPTFENDLIATLYNQVYVGSLVSREVYVSKVDDYTDYSFATPRAVGEGALFTFDETVVGMIPQEDQMYFSCGQDQWYRSQFQLSADLTNESLTIQRLKTNSKTGARMQSYMTTNDNKVVYVNFETAVDSLGRVENIFAIPDIINMSDVIRDDMNAYDWESPLGDICYWKNFLYISVPQEHLVLVFNVNKGWWEAPQNLPIGKFSIIDGELFGHSAYVPETYKLFDGFNDNSHPILAIANFSYQNFGTRANLKSFNEYYVEGYIASNTALTLGINYEIDGCQTETSTILNGNDRQVVCIGREDNSLGKNPLGKFPLGSLFPGPTQNTLPPKFRVIKTFPRKDFFEVQFTFSSLGVDQRWELLAFGPEASLSKNDAVYIKQ